VSCLRTWKRQAQDLREIPLNGGLRARRFRTKTESLSSTGNFICLRKSVGMPASGYDGHVHPSLRHNNRGENFLMRKHHLDLSLIRDLCTLKSLSVHASLRNEPRPGGGDH
jgi:hypothetical protein